MTSIALVEGEIPSPLYETGKKKGRCFFLALMVAVVAFPLYMDFLDVMVLRIVPFLNKR